MLRSQQQKARLTRSATSTASAHAAVVKPLSAPRHAVAALAAAAVEARVVEAQAVVAQVIAALARFHAEGVVGLSAHPARVFAACSSANPAHAEHRRGAKVAP